MVIVQVTVLTELHPVHEEKVLLPAVAGALRRTVAPAVWVPVKLVVPVLTTLLLGLPTVMTTPLAGLVEFTVNT
jgi:hypothetical protein